MENFIRSIHSGWAYLALILLLIAAVNALMGMGSNKSFTAKDRKIALFALIASHLQLLFGLVLYFVSPYFKTMQEIGMGEVMKNSELRLFVVEHPMINIIAIVLITMGWSKHKKAVADKAKFKSIGIFYIIGLVLLLSRIPWNNWLS